MIIRFKDTYNQSLTIPDVEDFEYISCGINGYFVMKIFPLTGEPFGVIYRHIGVAEHSMKETYLDVPCGAFAILSRGMYELITGVNL